MYIADQPIEGLKELSINGIPYPIDVRDEDSLREWISHLNQIKLDPNDDAAWENFKQNRDKFKVVEHSSYFNINNKQSMALAKSSVCQSTAMDIFTHLMRIPGGQVVWREEPEFDIHVDNLIRSDLSKVITRKDICNTETAEGKKLSYSDLEARFEGWAFDFTTDNMYPVAAPKNTWYRFLSYVRYCVMLNGEFV